jgi:hypothetical protein
LSKISKTERLFLALIKKQEFTANAIKNRFGLKNPRSAVYALRKQGEPVKLIKRRGNRKATYSIHYPRWAN